MPTDDHAQETFSQRLQRLRFERNLTQAQLADASGLPLPSIRNWERGQRSPGLGAGLRLARALGISLEYLAEVAEVWTREPPVRGTGAGKPHGPRRPKTMTAEATPATKEKKRRGKKEG